MTFSNVTQPVNARSGFEFMPVALHVELLGRLRQSFIPIVPFLSEVYDTESDLSVPQFSLMEIRGTWEISCFPKSFVSGNCGSAWVQ